MKTKPYVVRAYRLSQHILPHIRIAMETKDLAIALAEILLEKPEIHYITIMNHQSEEEVICFHKELVIKE